jgi:hypothetical protein
MPPKPETWLRADLFAVWECRDASRKGHLQVRGSRTPCEPQCPQCPHSSVDSSPTDKVKFAHLAVTRGGEKSTLSLVVLSTLAERLSLL